jgi:hypothetical protein
MDIEELRGILELMREFRVAELSCPDLKLCMVQPDPDAAIQSSTPKASGLTAEELRERYQGEKPQDGMASPYEDLLGPNRGFPGMEE